MRILLDECVNPRLRLAFPGDQVKTVDEMNWRSLTNGRLLQEAAAHFDVLVTLDRNLRFQNATGKYPLGIVVLVTKFNDLATYRPQFVEIRDLTRQAKPETGQSASNLLAQSPNTSTAGLPCVERMRSSRPVAMAMRCLPPA
jgi:hypothetical protein